MQILLTITAYMLRMSVFISAKDVMAFKNTHTQTTVQKKKKSTKGKRHKNPSLKVSYSDDVAVVDFALWELWDTLGNAWFLCMDQSRHLSTGRQSAPCCNDKGVIFFPQSPDHRVVPLPPPGWSQMFFSSAGHCVPARHSKSKAEQQIKRIYFQR